MKLNLSFWIGLIISYSSFGQTGQYVSKVWVADNQNGTYKNPVINADYSDPDAIRVGDDYYLVASSFEDIPGLPILHSKDLVNWTLIGHALKRQPPFDHFSINKRLGKAGGVLLLMANDSANCDLEHFNKLANAFGITFSNKSRNMVKNDEYETGLVIPNDKQVFKEPYKMYLKEISVLNVKAPAKALVTKEGGIR